MGRTGSRLSLYFTNSEPIKPVSEAEAQPVGVSFTLGMEQTYPSSLQQLHLLLLQPDLPGCSNAAEQPLPAPVTAGLRREIQSDFLWLWEDVLQQWELHGEPRTD